MTQEQYLKNLTVPTGMVDVVLDTDTFNEIDDQFAISYMLRYPQKLNVKGITAAPFSTRKVPVAEGMHKSYDEILKVLKLNGREDLADIVYKGSETYLPDENTPVESPAADFMAELAKSYSPEQPLYIIAIGAITNVASAFLKNPQMKENCVVVWLGGHAEYISKPASEFNMKQDIAGARVVMGSGVPLVQLPCDGVVDRFAASQYELLHWLKGKNPLCDYLCDNTIYYAERHWPGLPWSKPIWDVTAVAWLLNDAGQFMEDQLIPSPIPEYDHSYGCDPERHLIRWVKKINRENLFADLYRVLGE